MVMLNHQQVASQPISPHQVDSQKAGSQQALEENLSSKSTDVVPPSSKPSSPTDKLPSIFPKSYSADSVPSLEFIPVLESSGLIVDVGRWVIRTACEYVRTFLDKGIWQDHMRLSINISPRQFRDPQLLEIVQHSMNSYNIGPKFLNFEVTENLVIDDVDEAIEKMEAIKSLGAMFSIDDFGIGYSSMIYLKRLPFDQLKIDREFIRNIHRDPETRGVVEAIMAVSKQYGLKVTAEG